VKCNFDTLHHVKSDVGGSGKPAPLIHNLGIKWRQAATVTLRLLKPWEGALVFGALGGLMSPKVSLDITEKRTIA
jgi:hypothetical protein